VAIYYTVRVGCSNRQETKLSRQGLGRLARNLWELADGA